MLTQKELKELLHYNPETGAFTWRVSRTNRIKVGDVAGNTHKNTGYLQIRLSNKLYQGHRLAWLYMTGEWPRNLIDHVNLVTSDNRWSNLRPASKMENQRNAKPRGVSSKYKGINLRKDNDLWRARISVGNKRIDLGSFECEHEAALVYNQAAIKYFGSYAWLNKVYSNFDVLVGEDV